MKKAMLLLLVLSLLTPAFAGGTEDTRTLTGRYNWNRGGSGDLEAIFTATGQNTWDVDFHFRLRGQAHVYSGSAQGSLAEGDLQGKVKNENRQRTLTFEGSFENGTFRGRHAEIRGGGERRTATPSTLRPDDSSTDEPAGVL